MEGRRWLFCFASLMEPAPTEGHTVPMGVYETGVALEMI